MNGGLKVSYEFIANFAQPGWLILDVGAGASPLPAMLAEKECKVDALDVDRMKLETAHAKTKRAYRTIWANFLQIEPDDWKYDLIIASYSIQHMMGGQAQAWAKIPKLLRWNGHFIHVGRYRKDAPIIEKDRDDPLVANNELTINALAMNSGMTVLTNKLYRYEGENYREADSRGANAMISVIQAWMHRS